MNAKGYFGRRNFWIDFGNTNGEGGGQLSCGVTFQDSSIWYDSADSKIESTCHLKIRVKPLQ